MAMAMKREEGTQLYAIDPFPEPTTYEGWMAWLRRETKTSIKLGEESDFWKIAIDGFSEDADKGGSYQSLELILGEDAENERKVIEVCKNFFSFWKKVVLNDPKARR